MKSIHISIVFNIIGICLILESGFMLLGVLFSVIFHENTLQPILISSLITFFSGLFVYMATTSGELTKASIRDSFLVVTLSWIAISGFGTLPYLLSHTIPSFTNALFESISGFTTTGSSILTDIETLPKSILFWRSETHWIGGMGIVALVIVVLPSLKVSGNHLFSAEGSFFTVEKIQPRLIDMAKQLWLIYILLTVTETVLLILAKMDWFDAICHSFATIATGGFSTKNTSISNYSPTIQYIITLFMFLSGMNFVLHYSIMQGNFKKVIKNEEWKAYIGIILIVTIILSIYNFPFYKSAETSFRHSIFQVISIITATGFTSADYEQWTQLSVTLMFFIMFIGASVGSTGGGIKIARHLVLFKSLKLRFKNILHPKAVTVARYNDKIITDKIIQSISSFVIIYFLTFIVGTFFMMITGLDPKSASSSVITTLGGIGPGLGVVGPVNNFAGISDIGKYYLSFNMILGRLEIISVLALFTRSFYKL